jgi:TolB-like protein
MTSSRSSSARARAAIAVLAAALSLVACSAHRKGAPSAGGARPPRIALFPPESLADSAVPLKRVAMAVEVALRRRGIEVVSGDIVGRFLQAHRIRATSGVDTASARAARDELDVDGILLVDVERYGLRPYPLLGLTMRLVAASDEGEVLWIDAATMAGDEAPGLLGIGLVRSMDVLERRVLERLTGSLAAYLDGRAPRAPICVGESRFEPRISYRAPQLDLGRRYKVAVLPFVNESDRRHAGEIVSLEFVRQLHAIDRFTVVEPGELRDQILTYRFIMEGGVSLSYAMSLLKLVRADLIVAGTVREYRDGDPPRVSFTALALDRETERIAWEATSAASGADGVVFFDVGAVKTAGELACRMVRRAAEQLSAGGGRRPVGQEGSPARAGGPAAPAGEPRPAPADRGAAQ